MNELPNPVLAVCNRIRQAEARFGRPANSVRLLAVSKKKPATDIIAAIVGGQRAFGENYIQEALPKITALREYVVEWHFLGAIQANKTSVIAENFAWVHTLDRFKIAQRLSNQRPDDLPPLNVCIEVNVSGEKSKAGISLAEVPDFVTAVAALPNLRLRGLMTLPAPEIDFERQRASFRLLADLLRHVHRAGMDTLSMGTTRDFEAAIAEGATIVRIGTAIFGARD